MKIALVNPIWTMQNILPINLAELAGYIRAHGYKDIVIIDLNHELRKGFNADFMVKRAVDIVNAQRPDVIGITCNTIHVPFCVEFCREYKKNFKTPIVLGGLHATFRPNQMLQLTHADYIVRGEGEETFLELLKTLEKKEKIDGVRGCSFRKGNKINHNPDRPMIKDLSMLPFPAYDLLSPYSQSLRRGHLEAKGDRAGICITASRGCPFGCIFCASYKMWRYQRRKPVARVMEEIRFLTKKRHDKYVYIADDCLNLNKKWLEDFLREIKKLNITWSCLMRIDRIDPHLLKRIRMGGCRDIYHGVESGSPRIRAMLDKKFSYTISNNAIINLVKQEINIGLVPTCSFMVGIPTETKKEMEETVNLCVNLKKIGADVQLWIMTPYPGSKVVQMYKNRLIKIDRWKTLQQSDLNTHDQLFLYRKFYYKYTKENPDFYMFKPNIKIKNFFKLYPKMREKINIFVPNQGISRRFVKTEKSVQKAFGNYITETKRAKYFVTASGNVQIESINDKKRLSCVYVSMEYPFRDVDEIIYRLNKRNAQRVLLSIKSRNAGWSVKARRVFFRLITFLTTGDIQLCLMRPMPLEVFTQKQNDLIKKLDAPKSCKECKELFKVNKRGNVELCTGMELFQKNSAAGRETIYSFFLNTVLWEKKKTNCMFSSHREILQLLKRNERAAFYMKKAKNHGCSEKDFYYYFGLCYKEKEQFEMALDQLKKAKKSDPSDAKIHFAMAQCYSQKKDTENMWLEIEKGLKLEE